MNAATCPHCATPYEPGDQFCPHCGLALAASDDRGPRLIEGDVLAATSAGRALQSAELCKIAGRASKALLAVTILQLLFGTILILTLPIRTPTGEPVDKLPVLVSVFGIGIGFALLSWWARSAPLPAAVVGLIAFITVHGLDAVVDPTAIVRGIVVKIIVIVVLAQAISAALKHQRLKKQMNAAPQLTSPSTE